MSRDNDEMEDSLYEDHLYPPQKSSGLVNSPTTDTLDSVALETSPMDEQDLLSATPLPREQDLAAEGTSSTEEDKDLGISFAPVDISIDLNTSVLPSASASAGDHVSSSDLSQLSQVGQVSQSTFENISHALSINQDPQELKSISSYFSGQSGNDDIFDTIGKGGGDSERVAPSAFDELNSVEPFSDETLEESPLEASLQTEDLHRTASDLIGEVVEVKGVEVDVTLICHREHKVSTSEPEPVSFEGVHLELGEEAGSISDLTVSEKDEFESFTAAEGSDVIQHTGLVERSDSLPHDSVAPTPSISGVQQQQQHLAAQKIVEEVSSIVQHGLAIQGPSVGTTPTNMSPLHTISHQSSTVPPTQSVPQEAPRLDRQTSGLASDTGPQSLNFPSFGEVGISDDIFTTSLIISDADRCFDAWIPSDATRHILISVATSAPGTYSPAVELLSTPGVLSMEPQGDPVKDLVYRYMGEQEAIRRHVLTADSVSQDSEGLQKLVSSGCLRAAVDLTGRMLVNCGQGLSNLGQTTQHSPHTLQLWFCRLALMVKLRMYEMAESEMKAFQTLDTPDLYFEFYPQRLPGRRGSMASFAMRMLHADLPHLNGRSQETLDRLYYILAVVKKIISNLDTELCEDGSATLLSTESRKLSKELWLERERQVLYKIASTLLSVRDYQASLAMYNCLLDKDLTHRAELLTGISRIHLQMGNVTKANEIHAEVEKLLTKGDNRSACRNAMNKGLSAMCMNNFSEAYSYFKMAVQLEPDNTCAVNNMAVCSLYLGRLKDALNTLEAVVHGDPARNLHEGILFNLCTLYELESSRALHKKQAVLDLVSKHKGDGFPVACLKMA